MARNWLLSLLVFNARDTLSASALSTTGFSSFTGSSARRFIILCSLFFFFYLTLLRASVIVSDLLRVARGGDAHVNYIPTLEKVVRALKNALRVSPTKRYLFRSTFVRIKSKTQRFFSHFVIGTKTNLHSIRTILLV